MVEYVVIEEKEIIGSWGDIISPEEIEQVEISIGTIVHLIRHYRTLETNYRESLIDKDYLSYKDGVVQRERVSSEGIDTLLMTKGSKFLPDFMNPGNLASYCKAEAKNRAEKNEIRWIKQCGKLLCLFVVHFSESIGHEGVISISELSEREQASLQREIRGQSSEDQIIVNYLPREASLVASLVVVISKDTSGVRLCSAYPGRVVNPFPNSTTQSLSEFEICQAEWEQLVFLD